jgi:NDP-sugar pyrophosphorylase family protein
VAGAPPDAKAPPPGCHSCQLTVTVVADWPENGIVQAVVLAGGMGTRLRSVVSDVPKPMAEIGGRPFLEYLIGQLRRDGFTEVILCSGFMAVEIERHFGSGEAWGIKIEHSVEGEARGTAGALKLAEPLLAGDRWLVMNGDSLFDFPLRELAEAHAQDPAPVTIALARVADVRRYGGVTCAPDGRITAFEEKPDAPAPGLVNGGVYIIERSVLGQIPADRPASLEREVLTQLAGKGLHGIVFDGYFVDIGAPEDYLRAERESAAFRQLAALS